MKWLAPALVLALSPSCVQAPPPPRPQARAALPAEAAGPAPTEGAEPASEAAAPPPVAPPYDLAADVEARTERLRAELGPRAKVQVVEGVFLVASPSGAVGGGASVTSKALEAYFNGRFARRPERAVAVLLFETAAPYNAYCKAHWGAACPSPYGFYSSEVRTVVMNAGPGLGTLTHELVHPIVEADFPKAPDWLNEGIASLYEAFSLPRPGEIRGHKNWRLPRLLSALRSPKERPHASLPALFAMSDGEFRGDREGLNYATARYFCQWLDGQQKLWPFYQAWRDGFVQDPTGQKAFAATMGKSPEDLDGEWAAWVKSL
ncbi:MAG TPA: hypothetical protein VFS43_34880 [Polyangiaceae bacterium]|nr:hypothetical protein [Polyangiaceae bacterium]